MSETVNVVVAGLGGQGVLLASGILGQAAFLAGHAVLKSEVHGMSQRGGAVASDVRWGTDARSPMVPAGEADWLVLLAEDQREAFAWRLRAGGTLLVPSQLTGAAAAAAQGRNVNLVMLGALSRRLALPAACWQQAVAALVKPALREPALAAFSAGAAA